MKKSRILLLLAALLLSSVTHAYLGRSEFLSVQAVAEYIKFKYPSNQYYYLGLGTSPSPVIAYLQTEAEVGAKNLPVSGFRFGKRGNLELTASKQENVHRNLGLLLPTDQEMGERKKILLIDLVLSGDSLLAVAHHVKHHFTHFRRPLEVSMLGLTDVIHGKALFMKTIPSLELITLDSGGSINSASVFKKDHFYLKMANYLYKDTGEFETFDLTREGSPVRQQTYLNFVQEIAQAKTSEGFEKLTDREMQTYQMIYAFDRSQKVQVPEYIQVAVEKLRALRAKSNNLLELVRGTNELVTEVSRQSWSRM